MVMFLVFFHFSDQKATNKVATALLILQFVFFAVLSVFK